MLTSNGSSVQSSLLEVHENLELTYMHYLVSTSPTTINGKNVFKWLTKPVTTMYIVCFAVAGIAVLLNAIVLAAVFRYARKHRPYTILVLNLCVADCIISISTITLYALQYFRLRELDNGALSRLLVIHYCSQFVCEEAAWTVAFYGSLLTIVTMSVYHLVALRWPHSKFCLESKQCIALALLLTWSLALGLGLLQLFIVASSYDHQAMAKCLPHAPQFCCQVSIYKLSRYSMSQELHKKILYSVFSGFIIVGFLVILCVYSYLVMKSWIMRRVRILTRPGQMFPTPGELAWRRLMATTAMLVAAFCLFWLPHAVYMCLTGFQLLPHLRETLGQEKLHMLKVALHTLGCLCGVADPFIYCLRVPEVQHSLQKAPGIRHMPFARNESNQNGTAACTQKAAVNV